MCCEMGGCLLATAIARSTTRNTVFDKTMNIVARHLQQAMDRLTVWTKIMVAAKLCDRLSSAFTSFLAQWFACLRMLLLFLFWLYLSFFYIHCNGRISIRLDHKVAALLWILRKIMLSLYSHDESWLLILCENCKNLNGLALSGFRSHAKSELWIEKTSSKNYIWIMISCVALIMKSSI